MTMILQELKPDFQAPCFMYFVYKTITPTEVVSALKTITWGDVTPDGVTQVRLSFGYSTGAYRY